MQFTNHNTVSDIVERLCCVVGNSPALILACVVVADFKRVVLDVHALRVVGRRLGLRVLLRLTCVKKGKCENHEEMRKVLPKGKTNFDALAKSDMAVLMSHVNSYARDSLNWAAPYDLEKLVAPQDL